MTPAILNLSKKHQQKRDASLIISSIRDIAGIYTHKTPFSVF